MKNIIRDFISEFSFFGSLPFYVFISVFILLIGEINLFYLLTAGLFFCYFFAILIRTSHFKSRPKKVHYKGLIGKIISSSFPSVHSWQIAMLTIFFTFYYFSPAFLILFGVLSLIVFFSRYYLKKHFVNDIVFGALFGVVESLAILLIWYKGF